jgi:predicted PolB exonuclease-like 3'-5' exonuclease
LAASSSVVAGLSLCFGIDGGEVERYFRDGKIKEVDCETDVVSTYQVWLRYELFRGTLSQDVFEASQARNLADFLKTRPNR